MEPDQKPNEENPRREPVVRVDTFEEMHASLNELYARIEAGEVSESRGRILNNIRKTQLMNQLQAMQARKLAIKVSTNGDGKTKMLPSTT